MNIIYEQGVLELIVCTISTNPIKLIYTLVMAYLFYEQDRSLMKWQYHIKYKLDSHYLRKECILITIIICYLVEENVAILREFIVFQLMHVVIVKYKGKFTLCEAYLLCSYVVQYYQFTNTMMFEYLAQTVLMLAGLSVVIIQLCNWNEYKEIAFWATLILIFKVNFFTILYVLELRGSSLKLLLGEICSDEFMKYFGVELLGLLLIVPISMYKGPKVIRRKLFHFQIVIIIGVGLYMSRAYTKLALATFIWLLVVLEQFRQIYYKQVSSLNNIETFMLEWCDDRDSQDLIITHIYLLMGVSHAVLMNNQSPLLGVIVLGVGDSFAAIIGSLIGRIKYPRRQRTLEGSLAFVASCMVFDYYVNGNVGYIWIVVAIVEGYTKQIDNLILPGVVMNILEWSDKDRDYRQPRRTKIVCSVNESSNNVELLRQMIQAGANSFSMNMAYIKTIDQLDKLNHYRNELEIEFDKKIPINVVLKGNIIRVGELKEPEINLLYDSDVILTSDTSYVGDSSKFAIDSLDLFDQAKVGDELGLDYGQIVVQVISMEPGLLICKCVKAGLLKAYKPVFLMDKQQIPLNLSSSLQPSPKKGSIEFLGDVTQMTQADTDAINYAKRCSFDSITLSSVTSYIDLMKTRQILGPKFWHMQVFARISGKLTQEELEKILREADGCIVARSYITMTLPVEDVVKFQAILIQSCRRLMKPVFVATQVLESMLMHSRPTFAEMGDISNVVRQFIDGVMLSGETSYGKYPIEVIKTLDRVCKNIEKNVIHELQVNESREHTKINFSGKPVAAVIAQSAVEMAYILKASAILLMTVTVGTATKISKLRAPCQILAVTQNGQICRALQYVNGVSSMLVNNFDNQEQVMEQVLNKARADSVLVEGDFVVVISGEYQLEQEWHIDQMKVVRI